MASPSPSPDQQFYKNYHALSCQRSPGGFPRHHALNNVVRRALISANVPCTLKPPGLSRSDGKRPDELTLTAWQRGYCLIWDTTCVNALAASHLNNNSKAAAFEDKCAAKQKHLKYGRQIK
ncbi:hypothetical protein EVAR_16405_1 [Eumeta japonica]|uniref:Uncharacterized protein n=1 Tax=Eumeta variegata TaxID=151549 RepID=A0A4C1VVS8_EUMVA|nr:hypothetical protein EVAR_16405_1 [Eumeta japonica]